MSEARTKILITEDEGIVAMDVEMRLQALGYHVSGMAASGEEAIALAERTRPDLVLMDIKLQGELDGVAAAEQIRARFDIPVIYLTAFADDATLQRAKVTEPYGYLIKPFEERELLTAIEIALYKHRMEARLRRSEQWLATTLRSIGDAVIATDEQGGLRFMNPVAEALTGWTQAEALGRPLPQVFHIINESTRRPVSNPVDRVLREGAVVDLADHMLLIHRDGSERPIAIGGAPIRCAQGEIIGVVLVFRDVTDQRRVETELQKVERLEAIGLLAGGIAHDFNNLLTGILGNIDLALSLTPADGPTTDVLTAALKASWRARDLTQQLLTFAKGGAPIKQTVRLGSFVREATEFALRGSNVRCEFRLAADLWPAEVDPGQMTQVISNLVINADQAMPNGGRLDVCGRNVDVPDDGGLPVHGRHVVIEITDCGLGIPAAHLARIFDPYFSTKQKGSGLGLATVFSIVKRHGGHLCVASQLGKGTTFRVYLPAAGARPAADAETEAAAPSPVRAGAGQGRVLVMDDEELVRNITVRVLQTVGFETVTASNGAEAVRLYQAERDAGRPFDVVILDLTVPGGMGGAETVQHLRRLDPAVKAIVASGYNDNAVLADYAAYGFVAALSKPYAIDRLCRIVLEAMGGASEPPGD